MAAIPKSLELGVVLPATIVTWGTVLIGSALVAPAWAAEFKTSHGEISLALTLCQLGQGVLGPLAGYAVAKISLRVLLIVGLLLTALGLALAGLATGMWQIVVLYALPLAAGTILTGPLITTVLGIRLFPANKGVATSFVIGALAFSSFLMPPLMKVMLEEYGWRYTEFAMAAICAFILVPPIFLLVRTPGEAVTDTTPDPALTTDKPVSFGDIARDRVFWALTLGYTPLLFVFNGVYYNIGFNIADQGGTAAEAAKLLAIVGISSLPGMFLYGWLVDRVSPIPLFVINVLGMASAATASALFGTYPVLLISMPVWAFFQGGTASIMPVIMARRFGTANFARASGFGSFFHSVVIFGTTAAAFGRDILGSFHAAYLIMLVVVPFCVASLLLFRSPGATLGADVKTQPAE